MLAHPTETIVMAKVTDPVARIAALVSENRRTHRRRPPRHMNGTVGASADEASGLPTEGEVECEVGRGTSASRQ
jgi:hypothetical protein